MTRLAVTVLGGFQIRLDGVAVGLPTRKSQALLAYLALTPGQAHPRDKLAALLWGGIHDASARNSLRQALFAIRKAVGHGALVTEGLTVILKPDAGEVDADAFGRSVANGSPEALVRAADLYRGDLLAGLVVDEAPFEEWLAGERERLRELALEALAKLLAHQRRCGALEAATQTALRLLALEPSQEPVHRVLMRLYAELGRRGAALRQYQQCVSVLRRELGADPEADTKALYQELLRRPSVPDATARGRLRDVADGTVRDALLVGREAEMATLRGALADAMSGTAQMVALVGDAGIGKTHLVTAAAGVARAQDARVMVGRCHENERVLPFAPWVDALRAGGVSRDDETVRALEPVWRAELARLLPEVTTAELPPASDDALRLFQAVTRLIEQRAARAPLVIVLEDLHWADESSLGLLAYLRRRVDGARVLIVITARAEELADATILRRMLDDLDGQRRLVSIALGPLTYADTTALVAALARAGTDALTLQRRGEEVWTVSEGNPFMAVETLRAVEDGTVGTADKVALPERVRRVIVGRLDRLGPHAREVVAVAAVIGREFEFGLLQRASGLAEPEAAAAVEELVRRRVLHGLDERFDFAHDRIREVAYEAMLGPRKKLVHRQVAEAMEDLFPDREAHAHALAHHYRDAGAWNTAVTYFRQAGSSALSRSAYREAVACFEEAHEGLRHAPRTHDALEPMIDVCFDLRTALYPLGEFERTVAYLREAEALADVLDDARRRGRVAAYLCVALRRVGDLERAIEAGERALSLAGAMDDVSLRVATTLYLAQALWFTGSCRRAVEVFRKNVDSLTEDQLRQRHGAPGYPGVFSMTDMATVLAELGEFAEAKNVGERGLAVADELAHPFTSIAAYIAAASVSTAAGEFALAISRLERALAMTERGDFPVQRISARARLGYAYLRDDRRGEGLALLEDAVQEIDRVDGFWRPRVLGWLSEGHLLGGRVDEAARIAERAMAITPPNARSVRAWMLRLAADIASHPSQADEDRAAGLYREAATLADALELRLLRAHCHLGLGRLYRSAGDARAKGELSEAIGAFRAMDTAYWRSIAESELRNT